MLSTSKGHPSKALLKEKGLLTTQCNIPSTHFCKGCKNNHKGEWLVQLVKRSDWFRVGLIQGLTIWSANLDTHNITSESAIPIVKENRVNVANGWETLRFLWDGWICFVSSLTFGGGRFPNLSTYLNWLQKMFQSICFNATLNLCNGCFVNGSGNM